MSKEWFDFSKGELLKLPKRYWNKTSSYTSILFVNTRKKHDSGYNIFAIIGCKYGTPIEICGYIDDFRFNPYWKDGGSSSDTLMMSDIAFDCSMKGVFRMYSRRKIYVGNCFSTTEWWLGEEI